MERSSRGGTRTHDLAIMSRALLPAELPCRRLLTSRRTSTASRSPRNLFHDNASAVGARSYEGCARPCAVSRSSEVSRSGPRARTARGPIDSARRTSSAVKKEECAP
jgi:hypothetical protein